MTILVCTANTTPQDSPGEYAAQDTHVSTGHTDTYLASDNTSTNYGTSSPLSVQDEFGGIRRSIFKFDLSSIAGSATVTSANLQVYQSGDGATDPMHCYGMLRSWVVGEATWTIYSTGNNWGTAGARNTTTDVDSTSQDSNSTSGNGVWRSFDVTSWAQDVGDGSRTDYGLLLGFPNEDDSSGWVNIVSADGTDGQRPELWIEYTELTPSGGALPLINPYGSGLIST